MRWNFLVPYFLCLAPLFAQTGFNKSYDLANTSAGFSSIDLSNDTLIIYGVVVDSGSGSTGLLFLKLDTLGNTISSNIYLDDKGDNFTRPYQNSLIKLSDGSGYAAVGQFFHRTNGYFVRYDNDGNVKYFREYIDTVYIFNNFKAIIEVKDNSFLICGNEADESLNTTNGFVLKVDDKGELVWEKKYKDPTRINFLGSILRKSDNCYIVGGLKTDLGNIPASVRKYSSWIIEIDSLGDIHKSWLSDYSLEELGIGNLSLTSTGGIFYNSLTGKYNAEFNQTFSQPLLIFRDTSYKIVKRDTFGNLLGVIHNFVNIHKLQNGDWLTVGVKPVLYPGPPEIQPINSLSGWIARFEENGDKVWSVVDTAFWSNISGSDNNLYDAVELSSGSIVACGYSRTREPVIKDWGWVIKVDRNGCVDTLFCGTVQNKEIGKEKSINVNIFPNPATDQVNFSFVKGSNISISVLDCQGSTVGRKENLGSGEVYIWDCLNLPRGIYFYQVQTIRSWICGKIILH